MKSICFKTTLPGCGGATIPPLARNSSVSPLPPSTTITDNVFGGLTFSNLFTNQPYADFLIGIPTTASRSFPAIGDWPMWRHYAFFATDDFKITPSLTLNIGVRYEYTAGFSSQKGYLASFDIGTGKIVVPDGMLGQVSSAIPRSYVDVIEASKAGYQDSYLIKPDRNNFAPRIGLAYRPWGDTTVFR